MERFDLTDETRLHEARAAFAESALVGELRAADGATASGAAALSPARLYAYAQRREAAADLGIERALRQNAGLRALYRRMLTGQALYHAPAAMAAASTEIPPRAGDGWRITAERSQAEQDQYIVVIELTDGSGAEPDTLILCDREEAFHHFPVPAARRGVIQMILSADSAVIGLLRDPRTEVFLR